MSRRRSDFKRTVGVTNPPGFDRRECCGGFFGFFWVFWRNTFIPRPSGPEFRLQVVGIEQVEIESLTHPDSPGLEVRQASSLSFPRPPVPIRPIVYAPEPINPPLLAVIWSYLPLFARSPTDRACLAKPGLSATQPDHPARHSSHTSHASHISLPRFH